MMIVRKWISWLLLLSVILSLTACARDNSDDLMITVNPNEIIKITNLEPDSPAVTDFAVRLFRESFEADRNTLISPLSVLCALSMTANGARGETLQQMETVLGLDVDSLNSWISSYMSRLSLTENARLKLANSIWFRDAAYFTVEQAFLQTNADYFGAGLFRAAFDEGTCRDINSWVKDNTDGMIRNILNEISDEAVMYLVNALAFDAQWEEIYRESAIWSDEFTTEQGQKRTVDMMHSTETKFLEDELAMGFLKYYEGGEYAFAALLPHDGVTVEEYLQSLTGEALHTMLSNPENITVHATMPKFELEYDVEMSDILETMGMTDAFDGAKADLTGIGHSDRGNLYINRVIHKTYICVDGKGTKAGAATAVEVNDECAMIVEKIQVVTLDRPFVYMIVDTRNNIPFFIGTMLDPTGEFEPVEESELKSAPEMTADCGGEVITVRSGNCSWEGPGINGERMAFVACGAHPLDNIDSRAFQQVQGASVILSFPVMPDGVEVLRWRGSELGNPDAPAEPVELENWVIPMESGDWVYEVTARWDRDTWGGEASYHLYLTK